MRNNIGDKARLNHILDAVSEIEKYTKLKSFDNFIDDTMLQSACIRQLEIIGESANHLSDDLKAASKDVEWGEIIGLRHILIHKYFCVDLNIQQPFEMDEFIIYWQDMPGFRSTNVSPAKIMINFLDLLNKVETCITILD